MSDPRPTLNEVRAAIRKLDPSITRSHRLYDTALFMMETYLGVGQSDVALSRFTGLSHGFIIRRIKNLRLEGLWSADGKSIIAGTTRAVPSSFGSTSGRPRASSMTRTPGSRIRRPSRARMRRSPAEPLRASPEELARGRTPMRWRAGPRA